ncbi:hypothetical protein ACF0H5_013177 [Mactra antiquata]
MKVLIFVALAGFLYLCIGENCFQTTDCNHLNCVGVGYSLSCIARVCTCVYHDSCIQAADCNGTVCTSSWHCLDNQCRCFNFGK